LVAALAGILIATPLPDEIGVGLAASTKIIATRFFILFSYLLHLIGILVILLIGQAI
jgi:hypothetical protein